MPKFFYIVRDKTGKKITSDEESSSLEELVGRLQAQGLIIVNVFPEYKEGLPGFKLGIAAKSKFRTRHYRVKIYDLVLLCRQLATLLGAGVTIMKSLDIISKQVSSSQLYDTIRDLEKNMEEGLSFHDALARHHNIFSELWINLAETGEATGNLPIVLNRLASYLERNANFRKKIVSALIYPAILMLVGTGALLFLTTRIIPTFAKLFEGFDITLPLLTRIIIAVSVLIRNYLLIMIVTVMIAFSFLRGYIRTGDGRRRYENFQFKLPLFGEFFRGLVVERFSSEMSTLVESGVPLLYSLEIAERSVGNLVMADIIRKVKEEVREGKSLNETLRKSEFFEPMVVQMVKIGEEIGELSQMFKRIDSFYLEYVETFLSRLTTMFEPIMLIFMGVIIGMLVVGMFLPIFQLTQIGR